MPLIYVSPLSLSVLSAQKNKLNAALVRESILVWLTIKSTSHCQGPDFFACAFSYTRFAKVSGTSQHKCYNFIWKGNIAESWILL